MRISDWSSDVCSSDLAKGKRQNQLRDEHIQRIVDTYQQRPEEPVERYARRVSMQEIIDNDYNLNISRYVSTAEAEREVDLKAVHAELETIESERSEEHTSELQSLLRTSYAVFCLKKKKK